MKLIRVDGFRKHFEKTLFTLNHVNGSVRNLQYFDGITPINLSLTHHILLCSISFTKREALKERGA